MKNLIKTIFVVGLITVFLSFYVMAQSGTTQYVYDDNGRLKAVIAPNGETSVYEYDAAGNIISITRQNNPIVTINSFDLTQTECATEITRVNIYGSGFIPDATQNTVIFNASTATIESATQNQITVLIPNNFSTGNVRITNANGSAEKFLDLSAIPSKFLPNSPPKNLSIINAGQSFQLCFDGTATKNISLLLENITITSLDIKITAPSGNVIILQNYQPENGQIFIDKRELIETGEYRIDLSAQGNQTGNLDFSLYEFDDLLVDLPTEGTPASAAILYPGQSVKFQFTGEELSYKLALQSSGIDLGQSEITLIRNSDEQIVEYIWESPVILNGISGDHTIIFDPSGTEIGSVVLELEPLVIETDGTPLTVNLTRSGQFAGLSFSATENQNFTLQLSGVTAKPSSVQVVKPDGEILISTFIDFFYTGAFLQFTAPIDGNYKIIFDPLGSITGAATFSLNLLTETTGTLIINDPATTFTTTSPGQPFKINFFGNQGQRFYLKADTDDFYHLALTINKPDGTELLSLYNFSEESVIDINNLPDTGNYTINLQPNFSHQFGNLTLQAVDNNVFISNTNYEYINAYFYSVSFNDLQTDKKTESSVSKEQSEKEKETPSPNSANLLLPTASYFYNGTAGEQFSFSPNQVQNQLNFTGGTMTIYKPDGTVLDSAPIDSGICNVTLPEDGVYRIEVAPEGDSRNFVFVKSCFGGPSSVIQKKGLSGKDKLAVRMNKNKIRQNRKAFKGRKNL